MASNWIGRQRLAVLFRTVVLLLLLICLHRASEKFLEC
jgi:hypothetical protein